MNGMELHLDPSRCIGCQACVRACAECDTHAGRPMIHLEYVDRYESTQTAPVVCMHCEDPTCAQVCPADAIKETDDGVVLSAQRDRCIGCSNCVLACPFGVPRYVAEYDLMMKCDLCYDRTSIGKMPMCATVCPSGALYYGPAGSISELRRERPLREFQFGDQVVRTRVSVMAPPGTAALDLDVEAFTASSHAPTEPEVEPLRRTA
jgi:Fe-S-cluster-containing dehydrogenase component